MRSEANPGRPCSGRGTAPTPPIAEEARQAGADQGERRGLGHGSGGDLEADQRHDRIARLPAERPVLDLRRADVDAPQVEGEERMTTAVNVTSM
jgi:hypothetical protein